MEIGSPGSSEAPGDASDRRRAAALAVATSTQSPRFRLWLLVRRWGGDKEIARAVARNPRAGRAVLRSVVRVSLRKGLWQVAVAAIDNPSCSRRMFEMLSTSPYHALQAAIASSPRTPPRVLERLVGHPGAWMRLHVATNPSLAPREVDLLINDADAYVRCVAAGHPNASGEELRRLCAGYREAAWTLRAAAANAACPADLSDQVLTWLALGGAGDADPRFDPVTCTGHPGRTTVNAMAWYVEEARRGVGAVHPLWRVRAAFPSTRERTLITTLLWLARDPQPGVRRVAARFNPLPLSELKVLAADDDPIVASLASAAIKAGKYAPRVRRPMTPRRFIVYAARITAVVLLANGAYQTLGHQSPTTYPDQSGLILPSPSGLDLPAYENGLQADGTVDTRSALPGGGEIQSGTLGSNPGLPYVGITAGSVALTVSIPGAFLFAARVAEAPDPLTVPAGGQETLAIYQPASPMPITVHGSDGSVTNVSLKFS